MFIDYREDDAPESIDCELCIVGAGAAGISMALALRDSGIQVCLLESGGLEFDQATYDLSAGESIGLSNADPLTCRFRIFGGETTHWGGFCAPLRDFDFMARPWIPNSGWPISLADLEPFYRKAQEVCELGPYGYDADAFLRDRYAFPEFDPDKLDLRFWQFSPPTRFGKRYREELRLAENVAVHMFANVTRIVTNDTASEVKHLEISTLEGKKGRVSAKEFVLACGGMENPRQLLLNNQVEEHGLGNGSGLVGRYFMQHVELPAIARIRCEEPLPLFNMFKRQVAQNIEVAADLNPTLKVQEKHQLLNCGFTAMETKRDRSGYDGLRNVWHQMKEGEFSDDFGENLWTAITDLDSTAAGIYSKISNERYRGELEDIQLWVRTEQMPNPDSRIELSRERDPFGLSQVKVNWRLTEHEKRSIRGGLNTVAGEFGRLGRGRMQLADWLIADDASWHEQEPIWGGCHHMGTTRMSESETNGVVDRNCRLHTVHNLYVAGSSVFPTTGYVTPTFTIVALALRLADHLRQRFQA